MEYDYVVVGGGIAGCVLASRLHEKDPKLSIVLLEAGEDVSHRPEVEQGSYARLLNTDIDWGYTTVPQRHLQDRELGQNAGKGLGGSSIINACMNIPMSSKPPAGADRAIALQVDGLVETKATTTLGVH